MRHVGRWFASLGFTVSFLPEQQLVLSDKPLQVLRAKTPFSSNVSTRRTIRAGEVNQKTHVTAMGFVTVVGGRSVRRRAGWGDSEKT